MSVLRRRVTGLLKEPQLVILTGNPGRDTSYMFLKGYKLADILIMGGGGGGGFNSGGGGASGTAIYVKDFTLTALAGKVIRYKIGGGGAGANSYESQNPGGATTMVIDGKTIMATGGGCGFGGGQRGGGGGDLNESSNMAALINYVWSESQIAIANNGGGAGGAWNNTLQMGGPGGSGASFVPYSTNNGDGTGGNSGSNAGYMQGVSSPDGGIGYRRNALVIPIKSIFAGGGKAGPGNGITNGSGAGAGAGGGAAGYGSGGTSLFGAAIRGGDGEYGAGGGGGCGGGGNGGNGGQGIICLYYHN